MRRGLVCVLLSVSAAASGCGSVYSIRGKDQRRLEGVPFFPHVGVCRQESSYVQPVYRVAVQLLSGNRETPLFDGSVTGAALSSTELRDLRREVLSTDADLVRIGAAFDALTRATTLQYDPQAPPSGLFLGRNILSAESQVDYSQPLFMNVSQPWIGSASASVRLAPDGTLAEASAEIKDTTADTLLGWLPGKEILTAFLPVERARALGAAGGTASLQLVLEPRFVSHTYIALTPAPCPTAAPVLQPGAPGTMYRREQMHSSEPKER
jgi:hypothetical protein